MSDDPMKPARATPAAGSTRAARRPRGYEGLRHETLGSDILAVRDALAFLSKATSDDEIHGTCRKVLGVEAASKLEGLVADRWYPIGLLLDLMETIDTRIGHNGLRRMGRLLFQRTHAARFKEAARVARDLVYGIDGMYNHANRGTRIGGWTVRSFSSTLAELEKTTPHHCAMEEGILSEACATLGVATMVSQRECFRNGAEACVYVIMPTSVGDLRWG
ncbi:MAG: hypothetical protein JNK05_31010 [Myxococcales bacterium]|nr:hypothetical protein [Myxococcales bacterium]